MATAVQSPVRPAVPFRTLETCRYASARGIRPGEVNDEYCGFISSVRQSSLHWDPNRLHRQVTLIWNEEARVPRLGLKPVR